MLIWLNIPRITGQGSEVSVRVRGLTPDALAKELQHGSGHLRLPFAANQPTTSCAEAEFDNGLGPGAGLAGLDGPNFELRLFGKGASQRDADAGAGAVDDPAFHGNRPRNRMHNLNGDRAPLPARGLAALLGTAVHKGIDPRPGIRIRFVNAGHR